MNPINTPPQIPVIPPGGLPRPTPNTQPPNTPPTIYMIRHGEKNTLGHIDGPNDDSLIGLNIPGDKRAAALPYIFNNNATNPYDIRLVIAMQPQPNGDQERPFQTIMPLFLSLLQTRNDYCLLDNTVLEDNVTLAAQRINNFINSGSPGNILLCWEHHNLKQILESFGFKGAPKYPGARFDVVWELNPIPFQDHHGHSNKAQWTYNQIKWSTEGTEADLPEINTTADWIAVTGAPDDLVTVANKSEGPVFAWSPAAKPIAPTDD